jgi:hypothetical protein
MNIFVMLAISSAFLTAFLLFYAQYQRDKRLYGHYQLKLFWDFSKIDEKEKRTLILALCCLVGAIIFAIQGGGE